MRFLPLLALALLAAGCISPTPGPDPAQDAPPEPPTPPEACAPVPPENVNTGVDAANSASVSNPPGAFSYSRQGIVTAAKSGYVWENPAHTSRFSGSLQGSGGVRLQVSDACGKVILDRTLDAGSGSGSEALPEGAPGSWAVQLGFTAFSSTVGFSLTL